MHQVEQPSVDAVIPELCGGIRAHFRDCCRDLVTWGSASAYIQHGCAEAYIAPELDGCLQPRVGILALETLEYLRQYVGLSRLNVGRHGGQRSGTEKVRVRAADECHCFVVFPFNGPGTVFVKF